MFPICFTITVRSTPNSVAICACVSHTVSSSIRTSNRMLLSGW